jgi:hypothetical protein
MYHTCCCCRRQVVYFRANSPGACDYVNDSRYWRYSHGTCWSEVADDLLVVDVPGDHFSLLRQVRPLATSCCTASCGVHSVVAFYWLLGCFEQSACQVAALHLLWPITNNTAVI